MTETNDIAIHYRWIRDGNGVRRPVEWFPTSTQLVPPPPDATTPQGRVALFGCGGCGKTQAARGMEALGWQFLSTTMPGKNDLEAIVQKRLGFSAHTEVKEQKAKIRAILEAWIGACGPQFFAENLNSALKAPSAYERIYELYQTTLWKAAGYHIIEVRKPGITFETEYYEKRHKEVVAAGHVDCIVHNNGTLTQLTLACCTAASFLVHGYRHFEIHSNIIEQG